MYQQLIALIPQLAAQSVLVVGDVILDEYLIGTATRMSREAPVPILEYKERRVIPGGAANPAANIAALGAVAVQFGVVGDDDAAVHLTDALRQRGIQPDGIVQDPARPTTVKTRLMAHMGLRFPQQVARLDRLSRDPITEATAARLMDSIQSHIQGVSAVLLSDYRNGLLTPALVAAIAESARLHDVLLTADAQGDFLKYRDFDLVKCNAGEAIEHLGRDLQTAADFESAATALRDELALRGGMVITRGADGATLALANGETHHCPSPAVTDVFDTVGAGDTAIAVTTLALCAGASYPDAVTLANYASGLVVRKVGNYAPRPDELAWALTHWEVVDRNG